MADRQTCPRRMAEMGPWDRDEGLDAWERRRQSEIGPSCSFCGSLHPDRFLELVREGWTIVPTDKTYKAYIRQRETGGPQAKLYYQHLSPAQRAEFIELHNTKQMKIGYPGRFYVPPFFTRPAPVDAP